MRLRERRDGQDMVRRLKCQRGAVTLSPLMLLVLVLGVGGVVAGVTYFLVSPAPEPAPSPGTVVAKAATPQPGRLAVPQPAAPQTGGGQGTAPEPPPQGAGAPDPQPGANPPQPAAGNAPQPAALPAPAAQQDVSMTGPAAPPAPSTAAVKVEPTPQAQARINRPKIDLAAVEQALWRTKTKDPKAFKEWMRRFEDEVNVIYVASLRRRDPNVDVGKVMPRPIRVQPMRVNGMLILRGYFDQNDRPGYQPKQDKLVFVFEQRRPYRRGDRNLSYTLSDDVGFYYRKPGFQATVDVGDAPSFVGFFVEPSWQATYYRPRFVWFSQPQWWVRPAMRPRFNVYVQSAPTYHVFYRSHYRVHYRPPGWHATVFYRRRWWGPGVVIRTHHPRGLIRGRVGVRFGVNLGLGLGLRGPRYRRRGRWYRGRKYRGRKWKGRKWKGRKWKGRKWKGRRWGHPGRGWGVRGYRGRGHRGYRRGYRRHGGKW